MLSVHFYKLFVEDQTFISGGTDRTANMRPNAKENSVSPFSRSYFARATELAILKQFLKRCRLLTNRKRCPGKNEFFAHPAFWGLAAFDAVWESVS